jgi:NAD(P)-dependent dehydrogenase (short-subunit alcohol dehydrogenase family)
VSRLRLEGKTAVVTGASRGIGREIALAIGREGAVVNLVARSRPGLEETKALIGQPRTGIFCADLRNEGEIEGLAQSIHSRCKCVDILVNVAGVWHDDEHKYQGPRLAETPVGQIDEVLEVGLRACFLMTRSMVPGMIDRRSGKILQISCGFAGPHEAVGWLHYYVTNRAIEAFTQGLAAELREHEVQVNCIAPWFVATEAVRRFYPVESEKALRPCEVAKLATFLVSADADHISGQVVELRSKLDAG